MVDEPRHLLSGYAAEILTREERRELMEAALADQEVFDRLVEEESWRRLLGDPGMRREILAALEHDGAGAGILGWLRRPVVQWAAGAAAAIWLAVILLPGVDVQGPKPAPPPAGEELVPKSLRPKATQPRAPVGEVRELSYGLELWTGREFRPLGEDHRFSPRAELRVRLETDFPAWVYLFAHTAGDDVYSVIYPQTEEEHSPRRGEILLPPRDDEKLGMLRMDETPDDEGLVLVVATARWDAFEAGRPTIASDGLEAAFARAERDLESVSWRRSMEDERVHLKIAEEREEMVFVARLITPSPIRGR